ncbi:MAG: hypothetical protein LBO67_08830 [Spirochaetaceae bacterium]|jgi:hypothetical protein|nr:hypothetical protein [Spirochaetaceae bacterium]
MFNIKLSAIIAIGALVVSFIVGLCSNINILTVVLRASMFCVVFFVFSALVYSGIKRFMPELFTPEQQTLGSRINILVEEPKDTLEPAAAAIPPVTPEPVSRTADPPLQESADTEPDKTNTEKAAAITKPAADPLLSKKLPDLETMAQTIVPLHEEKESDTESDEKTDERQEKSHYTSQMSNKTKAAATDFTAKYTPEALASALRTLLKQD